MRNKELINSFIIPFSEKLRGIDSTRLSIGAYEKSYLDHITGSSRYYTSVYAHILSLVLQYSKKEPTDIRLVDYGAGNGVLGIFAKYCGFGKVYINDLGKGATDAAAALAKELAVPVDGFITGDTGSLVEYFAGRDKPDVVTGMDVIEHIYDLDRFFHLLKVMNPALLTVLSTGANADNPRKAKAFTRQQIKDEKEGGLPGDNPLFGEATPPFVEIRASIIQEAAQQLTVEEINQLAKATRGMRKEDILKTVQQYHSDKKLPAEPAHPTNTCDPLSGSWSERLMTVNEYRQLYDKHGFQLAAYSGFYNSYGKGYQSFLKKMANLLVKFTGYRFAPFITLVGYK